MCPHYVIKKNQILRICLFFKVQGRATRLVCLALCWGRFIKLLVEGTQAHARDTVTGHNFIINTGQGHIEGVCARTPLPLV